MALGLLDGPLLRNYNCLSLCVKACMVNCVWDRETERQKESSTDNWGWSGRAVWKCWPQQRHDEIHPNWKNEATGSKREVGMAEWLGRKTRAAVKCPSSQKYRLDRILQRKTPSAFTTSCTLWERCWSWIQDCWPPTTISVYNAV